MSSRRPTGQADARQGGEDDLDALLAHFELSDKRQKEVQVLGEAPPPSPRVFATWTAVPTQVQPFPIVYSMHRLYKSTVSSTALAARRRTAISCYLAAVRSRSCCGGLMRISLAIKCPELLGYAAEYYDGKADKMRCYNDLFIYSPKKDRWTQVVSPGGCACTLGWPGIGGSNARVPACHAAQDRVGFGACWPCMLV